MRNSANWTHPLPLLQFDGECADGRTIALDDLHGRVLRNIAASGEEQTLPASLPGIDVTTICVMPGSHRQTEPTACIASKPETWTAPAILLGRSPDALSGWQILADQNGWLPMAWRAGDPGVWVDPHSVEARISDIVTHPIILSHTCIATDRLEVMAE
jgi:hypothetical protein